MAEPLSHGGGASRKTPSNAVGDDRRAREEGPTAHDYQHDMGLGADVIHLAQMGWRVVAWPVRLLLRPFRGGATGLDELDAGEPSRGPTPQPHARGTHVVMRLSGSRGSPDDCGGAPARCCSCAQGFLVYRRPQCNERPPHRTGVSPSHPDAPQAP